MSGSDVHPQDRSAYEKKITARFADVINR